MADTERTYSAIQALFADNTSGNISAQDLRDFVESMYASWASLYISSAAATTIAATAPTNWYLASGTSAEQSSHRMTVSTANRLTYTGTPDRHFHIALSVSMQSAGNSKVMGLGIGLNGAIETGSIITHKSGTAGDVVSTALHWDVTLSTNDYIEIFVGNYTDATNITLNQAYMFALGMFK